MQRQPHHIIDERLAESPEQPDPALNIVHLEDNPHDREFVRRVLNKSGISCEFSYAENFDQFSSALAKEKRNLILSDFTLPGYSGTDALNYARENYPDIPYIFVSGTIGEERAVESLKKGATDYVLKNNLSRLPAAVQQATQAARESVLRRQAEAALRDSERRFREMADNIRDVFWVSSADGRTLIYVSPGFTNIWGCQVETLHERPELWLDSIVEEDRTRVTKALSTLARGSEVRIEYRIRRLDGALRWIETRAYPSSDGRGHAHAVGVCTDITERKLLQEQLLQSQKMEAIGQLAGGVAHDFNNLLTVINGYASLMSGSDALPATLKKPVSQIAAAGERAANLTRQLLVFSRKQSMQIRPLNLNATIEESVTMLSRLIDESIKLELDLDPSLPSVPADPCMLDQILMNLVVNARDAMPQGGLLRISTSVYRPPRGDVSSSTNLRQGTFARLSVADSGEGIPADVLPRIFEPFFTTKDIGKGTGLGLAMVFGIIENHGGWIETESEVGKGTTFHLHLPVNVEPENSPEQQAASSENGRGTETILLVEDEDSVRELTQTVLQNYGYNVLTAATGREAFSVWRENSGRIKLLLTDVGLPDAVNGLDLASQLRVADPALKVVCMSGYGGGVVGGKLKLPSNVAFIQKPCAPRALVALVRASLDNQPIPAGSKAQSPV